MKSGSSGQGGKYVISFINCAVKKSKKHNCKNHNKRAILSQNHNLLAHVAKKSQYTRTFAAKFTTCSPPLRRAHRSRRYDDAGET